MNKTAVGFTSLGAFAWIVSLVRSMAEWIRIAHTGRKVWLTDRRRVVVREAAAEDGPAIQDFIRGLSAAARRRRYFGMISELPLDRLHGLTHFDASRESVLLAVVPETRTTVGLAEYAPADGRSAEVAVVVADEWCGVGLGRAMLEALLAQARRRGYEVAVGELLADNREMVGLARRLGFDLDPMPEDDGLLLMHRLLVGTPQRFGAVAS